MTFMKFKMRIAHQLSHYLTKTFDRIVFEDLNVKGMLKNIGVTQFNKNLSRFPLSRPNGLRWDAARTLCVLIYCELQI